MENPMAVFFGGSATYGKIDQIPGVAHVATSFVHFQGFPLFPRQTYVVVEDAALSEKWRSKGVPISRSTWAIKDPSNLPVGLPVPLRGKSVWLGYIRAILWVLLGISMIPALLVFVVIMPPEQRLMAVAICDLIPIVIGFTIWISYRLTLATPSRREELASFLGASPDSFQAAKGKPLGRSLARELLKIVIVLALAAAFITFLVLKSM
jgi:hypothetical protein